MEHKSRRPGSSKHNVVLAGHGHWGKNIARNLNDIGCLSGVFDPSEAQRAAVADHYPDARIYDSFASVIADSSVHGIAISSPAESHAEQAISALEAGKDVFVEKPLALTYETGRQVVEKAQELGRILMVGHLLEYHYGVIALLKLVRAGELGDLQYIYSNRLNLGKFRSEENILWSFAPHDIAVILRLVGESPIEVVATGGAYLQPNVADTTVTNLVFPNRIRAHIFVSWLHPYKEQRLVVVGSDRMAVFDDRAPVEKKLIVYDKGVEWIDRNPVPRQGDPSPVALMRSEPLRTEIEHFISCIETRTQPRTDGASGLRVLEVLEAAQTSIQNGGDRVTLIPGLSGQPH